MNMELLSTMWELEDLAGRAEALLLEGRIEEAHEVVKSICADQYHQIMPAEEVLDRLHHTDSSQYLKGRNVIWPNSQEGYPSPIFHWQSGSRSGFRGEWYRYMMFDHYEKRKDYNDLVRNVAHRLGWPMGYDDGFSEVFALSLVRKMLRLKWERIVLDIIRSRHRTPLENLARLIRFRLPWIERLCSENKYVLPGKLLTDEMVFICSDPDFDIVPEIDLPDPPEAKVVYLVICPNCKHRNEQGRTKCENCGAPL